MGTPRALTAPDLAELDVVPLPTGMTRLLVPTAATIVSSLAH